MAENKTSQYRQNPYGEKRQLLTVYLHLLGKLHAFSELLEVMTAHSSELFLLDETSALTGISFNRKF